MPQQRFPVQVTTLPDCDDITRFDGNHKPKRLFESNVTDPINRYCLYDHDTLANLKGGGGFFSIRIGIPNKISILEPVLRIRIRDTGSGAF